MAIQSKAIYRFNRIIIKILISFFTEIDKPIPKFIYKEKHEIHIFWGLVLEDIAGWSEVTASPWPSRISE